MKTVAFLVALAANLPLTAQGANPADLYRERCLSCHGEERMGAMAPALLPQSLERLKPAEVLATIRDGRPATQMPGFNATLSESEIKELAGEPVRATLRVCCIPLSPRFAAPGPP